MFTGWLLGCATVVGILAVLNFIDVVRASIRKRSAR